MIEFSQPWWLLTLVLIPGLSRLPAWRNVHDTLWYPTINRLSQRLPEVKGGTKSSTWVCVQIRLGLALLVIGLANPIYSIKAFDKVLAERDIMLVLDTSQSMETVDIENPVGQTGFVSRLDAVKYGLTPLLDGLEGNRIGLITFGEQSFVMSDLTARGDTVRYMMTQLETGFAGDSTRLGDAVGYAVSLLAEVDSERALVVLITDGNDTGSDLPPLEAARLAQALGVKLYIAAVGGEESAGRDPIDEDLLRRLVEGTGGEFFRIAHISDFDGMWRTLEQLEPTGERIEERIQFIPLAWIAWTMSFLLLVSVGLWATRPTAGMQR